MNYKEFKRRVIDSVRITDAKGKFKVDLKEKAKKILKTKFTSAEYGKLYDKYNDDADNVMYERILERYSDQPELLKAIEEVYEEGRFL